MKEDSIKNIRELHLRIALERGVNKTYCPSEVARQYSKDDWRRYMPVVRQVADSLIEEGKIQLLQNDKILKLKATEAKGPIRLQIKK